MKPNMKQNGLLSSQKGVYQIFLPKIIGFLHEKQQKPPFSSKNAFSRYFLGYSFRATYIFSKATKLQQTLNLLNKNSPQCFIWNNHIFYGDHTGFPKTGNFVVFLVWYRIFSSSLRVLITVQMSKNLLKTCSHIYLMENWRQIF